jgi:hypothetical protein
MKDKWRFFVYPIGLVCVAVFMLFDNLTEKKWILVAWFCGAFVINKVFIFLHRRFLKRFGNIRPSIKTAWIMICWLIYILYCGLFIVTSLLSLRYR